MPEQGKGPGVLEKVVRVAQVAQVPPRRYRPHVEGTVKAAVRLKEVLFCQAVRDEDRLPVREVLIGAAEEAAVVLRYLPLRGLDHRRVDLHGDVFQGQGEDDIEGGGDELEVISFEVDTGLIPIYYPGGQSEIRPGEIFNLPQIPLSEDGKDER